MGHNRLGTLPRTRKWVNVVDLLWLGRDVPEIASATLKASESGLKIAQQDTGLAHTFWLLAQLPIAANEAEFLVTLRKVGLNVSDEMTLLELSSCFTEAVDGFLRKNRNRSDLAEMAELAGAESLTAICGKKTGSLFGTTTDEVQNMLRELSSPRQFAILARDFFSRFTRRYLGYYLSRELSNQVGGDGRFDNIQEHAEFNKSLDLHCYQAARIIEDFARDWYFKTVSEESGITPEKAKHFAYVALKKIGGELKRGGGDIGE